MLCLFDGSSEGIAKFLLNIRISVLLLGSKALTFSSLRMLLVNHGFWLGYVRTVTVGTMSSMHLLMQLITDVVNSSILEHVPVCAEEKQSCRF
jgi:hypothetical protein